jgi:hypothetical protein
LQQSSFFRLHKPPFRFVEQLCLAGWKIPQRRIALFRWSEIMYENFSSSCVCELLISDSDSTCTLLDRPGIFCKRSAKEKACYSKSHALQCDTCYPWMLVMPFQLSKRSISTRRKAFTIIQWMVNIAVQRMRSIERHRNSCSCILHIWNCELHI